MKKVIEQKWLFACLLSLPMIAFFTWYLFNHITDLIPTGFIQYDNVSYIAFSKQYLDTDHFHFKYNNPFNDSDFYPRIYFQPQFLLFSLLMKLGVPPGWILIPFTIICTIVCFRILIAIYDCLFKNLGFRTLNIWLLCWGGGLLSICGYIVQFFMPANGQNAFDNSFILDPANGWWGLNLGRSLFFSCEAYYHVLFLGCIFYLLTRKWIKAFLLLVILTLSHPFTSIELIGIVCLWSISEAYIKQKSIPLLFIAGILIVATFYIYYYLYYLNQFQDHLSVSHQYSLNWRLRFYSMIPAYCLSGGLAIYTIYKSGIRSFFSSRENRLFTCWFAVAILLANHELFINARQPIHFTRGYIWTCLFLIGMPGLQSILQYLNQKKKIAAIVILTIIFFSDNILWLLNNTYKKETQPSITYINEEQKNVFKILNQQTNQHTLILSDDPNMSYLSTIYTKAYPWLSHRYTTPFFDKKALALKLFIDSGTVDSSWKGRNVVFIFRKPATALNILNQKVEISYRNETKNYIILKCDSLYFR